MRRGVVVFTVVITMLVPTVVGAAAPGEVASIDIEVVSSTAGTSRVTTP